MRYSRTLVWLGILLVGIGVFACQPGGTGEPVAEPPEPAVQPGPNTLTDAEKAEGWELLFNGKDLLGWRGFKMEEPPPGWTVRDDSLYFDATHGGEGYGDLTTREQFSDFILELEWKISEGGNSGVLFRVSEDYDQEFLTGPEVQLIDDFKYSELHGGEELEDWQKAGANYAMHPASRQTVKPAGEWNDLKLVVDGAHVEHWLNGDKVVDYDLWTDEWNQLKAEGKWKDTPSYGMNKTGYIVFQDHGAPVWFRNVKIKRLN